MEAITRINGWLNGMVWGPPMLVLLVGHRPVADRGAGGRAVPPSGHRPARGPRQAANRTAVARGTSRRSRPSPRRSPRPSASATSPASRPAHRDRRAGRALLALGLRAPRHGHQVRRDRGRAALPRTDAAGIMRGGAMYTLKNRWSAAGSGTVFALLTALAAFGIGNMVQANSVAAQLAATTFGTFAVDRRHRAGRALRYGDPRRHQAHRRRSPRCSSPSWRSSTWAAGSCC